MIADKRILFSLFVLFPAVGIFAQGTDSPEKRQADFALGLFQRGDYKEALHEFEVYLDKKDWRGDRDLCLFFAGEAHRYLKQPSQAGKHYETLLAEFPKSSHVRMARYRLAGIRLEERNGKAALELLKPLAEQDLSEELREGVFYSLGAANSLAGNSDQAIEWWKKTRKDFPTTDSGQRALFGLGAEFFRTKNWKEAERHFEEWLDRDGVEQTPAYPEAMLRLSECKERLGNEEEALRMLLVLGEIPSSSPVREEALVAAARLAFQLEDKKTFDRLASRMDAELKSPSARMGWHLTSGNRHYKEKRWKEAIRDYEKALDASKQVKGTNPTELEATENQIRIRLGWCLLATKEWNKAEAFLRPVTGKSAQTDEYWYLMAESLRQLEKWKESLDLFTKIPESSEYKNDSRQGEADAAYHVGDWEKGSSLYGSLAKETPKSPERVFFLLRAADSERRLQRWNAGAELCATAAIENR